MLALKSENISKQYRLGQIGTGTLSHDLNRAWHRMRGKEDPYIKIGEVNDKSKKAESEYVWALQDINFEIAQGDAVGIIGKNGAGKSTLLKILSKVTAPTTGKIFTNGRISSLLEVGTGFHPEMTGRENIFLNGAILGMTKKEIKNKFDEIVDFSGVEKYIDTPVKRYSSGMYVRLAFAVAAHLESEILIVDEVLAVGDAAFQKKCLGKMSDMSNTAGRTVLFVSHNMGAVQSLCKKGILLENGQISKSGTIDECIQKYIEDISTLNTNTIIYPNDEYIESIHIKNDKDYTYYFLTGDTMEITINFKNSINFDRNTGIGIYFTDSYNNIAGDTSFFEKSFEKKANSITYLIPKLLLTTGSYFISISVAQKGNKRLTFLQNILKFKVESSDINESGELTSNALGYFYINGKWS